MSDQVNENGVYHIPTMLGLLRGVTRELASFRPADFMGFRFCC